MTPSTPLRLCALAVAAASVAGCATGAAGSDRLAVSVEDWSEGARSGRRIRSPHFELFSTISDGEFEAELPGFLEAVYRNYASTLAPNAEATPRLTTYLFDRRAEWLRFAQARYPARFDVYSRIQSGGFTEDATAVLFYTERAATLATLAHEGWHQYAHARVRQAIPAWLNEGLACYHEAVDFSGERPRFTPLHNTFRVAGLREAVQTGRMMPLGVLVATDAGRVIREHDATAAQRYYAQAWALVTMLRHGADDRYREAFERMLREISDGSFTARLSGERLTRSDRSVGTTGDAVFRVYFGCAPSDIEGDYERHVLVLTGL